MMSLLVQDQIHLSMERHRVVQTLGLIEQDIREHGSTCPLRRRWQKMQDELQYIESTRMLVKWALGVERVQPTRQSVNTHREI